MATVFNAFEKTPGVYIQEILVPGPIRGVGTSTAVFIGPARQGPISEPTSLTNWTQFRDAFGLSDDFGPYFPNGGVFAPHAVRGFFDNGGTHCYFVRVSKAARAWCPLMDRNATPQETLRVAARDEGTAGNSMTVDVADASIAATKATRASASLVKAGAPNKNEAQVATADAAKFKPGDVVFLSEGANNDRATIASISGTTIKFTANLNNIYTAAGNIRIADLLPGQTTIRLDDLTGIERGSYVQVSQGATKDGGVINAIDRLNNLVTLATGLTKTYTMAAGDTDVGIQTLEFTLVLKNGGVVSQTFPNLSMDSRHSRYVADVVDADPQPPITVATVPDTSIPPANLPAVIAAVALKHGSDEDLSQITAVEYTDALTALEKVDDVNIVCVPDRTDLAVQKAMKDHCEKMQDRFAILDPPPNLKPTEITAIRNDPTFPASRNGYAALYYPQINITNPVGADKGKPLKVPPSGHLAGVYARVDNDRGVHKAPANEELRGVLSLERVLSDDENGPLNELSINVIRAFPGRGILVWGARTISTETQWRYINVRRLLLFIEESIQEGTQFAVFEPNNTELWQKVKRTVSEFLDRVWRSGALLGDKAEEAYRVRIDDELNPPTTIALGQLIIEVRVAPTTPAEFVVFQIIQEPGRKIINE